MGTGSFTVHAADIVTAVEFSIAVNTQEITEFNLVGLIRAIRAESDQQGCRGSITQSFRPRSLLYGRKRAREPGNFSTVLAASRAG
jgi:hypothetical protein